MARRFAELQRIDHDRKITKEMDAPFLYQLQNALLLALEEQGRLSAVQYRHAEEGLKHQRRERARRRQEGL